jgi:hypothetical protein
METNSVSKLLKQKKETKASISKKYSFSNKKPLLGIFLDKDLSKDAEKRVHVFLEASQELDVEVVVLADGNLDSLHLPNVIYLPYNRNNRKTLLEASDMALVFKFSDVEEMLLNGVIPISSLRPEVSDYNPNRETGNGFVFKKESPWAIFAALVRARETFKFPYDWKHIIRQGMGSIKS